MYIVRREKQGTRSIAGHFPGYTLARALHAMDEIAKADVALYNAARCGVKLSIVYHDKALFRFGRCEVHLVDDQGTVFTRFSQVWGPIKRGTHNAGKAATETIYKATQPIHSPASQGWLLP